MTKSLSLVALAVAAQIGHAQAPACSNATLNGAYGVTISGLRPAPNVLFNFPALPGTIEQVIGVAIQIFDGAGNFTQTDNVKGSLSGITPDRAGSGTYTVNSHCTGSFTLNNAGAPFPIVTKIMIVDGGNEFRAAVVSPQAVMVTSNGRKMH